MKRKSKEKNFEWISIISFLIMSSSFMLMAISQNEMQDDISQIIVIGISFWIPFILGVIMQIILYICYKKRKRKVERTGFWCFFKNKIAIIFDIMFIISVVALIVVLLLTNGVGFICYVSLSAVVFSFCMHCIFNGRVYHTLFT